MTNNLNNLQQNNDKSLNMSNNERSFFLSPEQQQKNSHNIIFENYPIQTRLNSKINENTSISSQLISHRNDVKPEFLDIKNNINTRLETNRNLNHASYIPNPSVSVMPLHNNGLPTYDKIIPNNTRNN